MTQRLDYTKIAPAGIKALGSVYGYILQSGLPRLLVNLVYLRTSQINERLQPAGHRISGSAEGRGFLTSSIRLSRPIPHRSTLGCWPSSASNNLPELATPTDKVTSNN